MAPAPAGGLAITLRSNDPGRLLLSTTPEGAGSESISLRVREGLRASPDFWIYGLGKSGTATYTASVPGFQSGSGTATLAPSGFLFARDGVGTMGRWTTPRAAASELHVTAALLDESLHYVCPQALAGGLSVRVDVTSSNPAAGRITASPLVITGGLNSASTRFQPASPGNTTLSVGVPPGFSAPAEFVSVPMAVMAPGLAVTTEAVMAASQVPATLSLGDFAPPGGVTVVLTSGDPKRLLLAAGATGPGLPELKIAIPQGGFTAPYFLQAMEGSGTVSYSATAPGYRDRTGSVLLAPSGVVIGGPPGPPDETESAAQGSGRRALRLLNESGGARSPDPPFHGSTRSGNAEIGRRYGSSAPVRYFPDCRSRKRSTRPSEASLMAG